MVQIVYDKIVDFCGVEIPCVVVGSKIDLERYVILFESFHNTNQHIT